jgi:glycosyltransferase involved in cell wall biosynthesis
MGGTRFASHKAPTNATQTLRAGLSEKNTHVSSHYRQHPWTVIHACERARDVLPLIEGQLAAGMRPSLLTPAGSGGLAFLETPKRERPISLLNTWSHVREWRSLMNESAAETACDILHAHSFSAGMAAVRASSCVVYQVKQPVEKLAAATESYDENSWLSRSFRVAEQFVLTRAAAVVVHDHTQRLACLERGVNAAHTFLIPEPIEHALLESAPDRKWLAETERAGSETVLLFVPGLPSSEWERRDALLRWMRVLCNVRRQHDDVRLLLLAEGPAQEAIYEMASACNLMPWIHAVPLTMRDKALSSADIVICDREHASSGIALEALARGRALLASDVEAHREITPDGRGCLWFRPGEVNDVAQRASFLAGNPQFRRALATAGREHCLATRSAEAVGGQYDAVYRTAFSKRKKRDTNTPKPQFIPLHVGS